MNSFESDTFLSARLSLMIDKACVSVSEQSIRDDIQMTAHTVAAAAWKYWLAWRTPADNRQEHEWIVFANVMKIAEAEKLSLSERRIATVFCFLHDTYVIQRIMEEDIRALQRKSLFKEADELSERKSRQRLEHMQGGAKNTRFLLEQLKHPNKPDKLLFSPEEINRCVEIVATHDAWKIEPPEPPETSDRLALACIEGDILWPLHPIGVLADMERPDSNGVMKDMFNPEEWRTQAKQSLKTMTDFRSKWQNVSAADFIDDTTIFRTQEGHRLYSDWRELWQL